MNQLFRSNHLAKCFALSLLGISLCCLGCYDPTSESVDAGSGAAKKEKEVVATQEDVTYQLTGANCDIKWTGSNSAGMTPYGYFYELKGKLIVDGTTKRIKHFEVDIDMTGVKAMNESLTKKLKTKGFFQVDEYPESRFVVTDIKKARESDPEGTTDLLEGNFLLRDTTKSILIPATVAVSDKGTLTLSSEFKLNRKDYGVVYSNSVEDALIRDDVLINIDIEAEKPTE